MRKKYISYFIEFLILIIFIIGTVLIFPKVINIFLPFIISFIIAAIVNPIIIFLENKIKIKKGFIPIIIICLVLFIIFFLLYLLISQLINILGSFVSELPVLIKSATTLITNITDYIMNVDGFEYIDKFINTNEVSSFAIGKVTELATFISNKSVEFTSNSINYIIPVFMCIIFTILSSFFIIKDKELIIKNVKNIVGEQRYEKIKKILKDTFSIMITYLKVQLIISFMIFCIVAIYLLIIGINNWLIIALAIAILDLLPILGAGTALIPWTIIEAMLRNYKMAILLAILYLITLFSRQFIQPKVLSVSYGVNAFLSLVIMYTGYVLFGFTGLIFSVPVYMIFDNLYKNGLFDKYVYIIKDIINDIRKIKNGLY